MKLRLNHRNHTPSAFIVGILEKELESLQADLQIDEARVRIERSLDDSPPFSVSFHLVNPGPDIMVRDTDHTLRAAMMKALGRIREKIGHRHAKRTRSRVTHHITASPRRLSPASKSRH